MTSKEISSHEIEQCQEAILEFLPAPVTDKHRAALNHYKDKNMEALQADTTLGGGYAETLCTLLSATQSESDVVESLRKAARQAVECAGLADGNELYSQLEEISSEHFSKIDME